MTESIPTIILNRDLSGEICDCKCRCTKCNKIFKNKIESCFLCSLSFKTFHINNNFSADDDDYDWDENWGEGNIITENYCMCVNCVYNLLKNCNYELLHEKYSEGFDFGGYDSASLETNDDKICLSLYFCAICNQFKKRIHEYDECSDRLKVSNNNLYGVNTICNTCIPIAINSFKKNNIKL